jgi:hypothetical protein
MFCESKETFDFKFLKIFKKLMVLIQELPKNQQFRVVSLTWLHLQLIIDDYDFLNTKEIIKENIVGDNEDQNT